MFNWLIDYRVGYNLSFYLLLLNSKFQCLSRCILYWHIVFYREVDLLKQYELSKLPSSRRKKLKCILYFIKIAKIRELIFFIWDKFYIFRSKKIIFSEFFSRLWEPFLVFNNPFFMKFFNVFLTFCLPP